MKKIFLYFTICFISSILIWQFTPNLVSMIFNSQNVVKEIPIKNALLASQIKKNPTYTDGFSIILPKHSTLTIDEIVLMSFKNQPSIIKKVMGFDESLDSKSTPFQLNVGDQFGQFQVIAKNEREIVLGEVHFPNYLLSYSLENNDEGTQVNIHNLTNFDSFKLSTFFNLTKPFHVYLMLSLAKGILKLDK